MEYLEQHDFFLVFNRKDLDLYKNTFGEWLSYPWMWKMPFKDQEWVSVDQFKILC
jgi:hypothetical protein